MTIPKPLLRILLQAAGLKRFLGRELHPKFRVPARERLRMIRHGFCTDSAVIYDFETYAFRDYLSDARMYLKAITINQGHANILNDKVLFGEHFGAHVRVPGLWAILDRGRVRSLDPTRRLTVLADLLASCRDGTACIIKPVEGGGGSGVLHLAFVGDDYELNHRAISEPDLLDRLRRLRLALVTECVEQAPYARDVFPKTTNTVKLLTILDPETKRAAVPIASHRFGAASTIPVDSLTQGGVCAEIDLESGVLARAARVQGGSLRWFDRHPETQAPITGLRVPGWSGMMASMLALAERFPHLPYVAWDIVMQEDGFTLLEGNANANVDIFQIARPLRRDARMRAFYAYYGVI